MIHCYCDGSCDPKTGIAVVGWFIDNGENDINNICLKRMENATCASAELNGLIRLLHDIEFLINTDRDPSPD